MKFSSVVRYIQKTKECRNSFLGILICHEIMFHVSMSYSVCRFLLTATELQVTYQLNGASLFFVLPRSRRPPCPTASSRRPQSSRRWIPRRTPSWPARPAGLGSCYSRRPTSTPPGTPASRRSRRDEGGRGTWAPMGVHLVSYFYILVRPRFVPFSLGICVQPYPELFPTPS